MFDPRPLYCSSLTTAVGGTKDTNFVDSGSPYCGTNQWLAGGASFGPIFHDSQMAKRINLCSRFGVLFPRVLGAQELLWGLGFHLASQCYVYIGSRVAFG